MSERPVTSDSGSPIFRFRGGRRVLVVPLILVVLGTTGAAVAAGLRSRSEVVPYRPDAGSQIRPLLSRALFTGEPEAVPSPIGGTDGPTAEPVVRVGEAGAVSVPAPAPWTVLSASASEVLLSSGVGEWFAAGAQKVDPTLPAADLLVHALVERLTPDRYALVRATDAETLTPFGSLVSWAVIGYSAMRVDMQGARTVGGNLFALIRDDGVAVVIDVQVTPVDRWAGRVHSWQPLFEGAAESLAGASLP